MLYDTLLAVIFFKKRGVNPIVFFFGLLLRVRVNKIHMLLSKEHVKREVGGGATAA